MAKELNIILQANYGYGDGWEDVAQYKCGLRQVNLGNAVKESRQDLEDYKKNAPEYSYRLVRRYMEYKEIAKCF